VREWRLPEHDGRRGHGRRRGHDGDGGRDGNRGRDGDRGHDGDRGRDRRPSGVAGATGIAGNAGTAGAAGASGGATGTAGGSGLAGVTGTGGGTHVMPSEGCGMPAGQALMTYVKYSEMVTGVTAKQAPRNFYVWLPANYNPMRAYPVVFVGPGCGSNGMQVIKIQVASGDNAIIVGLDPSTAVDPGGRQCFDSQTFPDPEVPYFDQTLKLIESKYCVDKSRLFIEGFSSGSWLSNLIGCTDAGIIRGQGNASGCMQYWPKDACKGPIAYFEAHNDPDGSNSYDCGKKNRDEKVMRNGCTTQTMPYDPGPGVTTPAGATISCVQYVGCMPGYPAIFCTTTGLNPNHNPQDDASTNLLTFGVWKFWMSLP
jgi:hypothetical protein